jgi:hypothetical protein
MKRSELKVGQELRRVRDNDKCFGYPVVVIATEPWSAGKGYNGKNHKATSGQGVAVAYARNVGGTTTYITPEVVQLRSLITPEEMDANKAARLATNQARAERESQATEARKQNAAKLDAYAEQLGVPVRVGEFGTTVSVSQALRLVEAALASQARVGAGEQVG